MNWDRVTQLEEEVALMKQQIQELQRAQKLSSRVDKDWKSNTVGDYMIKLVYPGIYAERDKPTAGFPQNRRKTAAEIKSGQWMFLYVTSPVKRIIGLTKVAGPMRVLPGPDERWPYNVPLEWEIEPRTKGVSLEEAGLNIRPRPGDTLYGITEEKYSRITELLLKQPVLTPDQWELLIEQHKDYNKESVSFEEAVHRLRSVNSEAADTLYRWYATDGTRRGWDEYVSKGEYSMQFPEAKNVIWPDQYK